MSTIRVGEEVISSSSSSNSALMTKPSFDDLPDELLLDVVSYLDLANRVKLRVNKKMDHLIIANTKLDRIDFSYYHNECRTLSAKLAFNSSARLSFSKWRHTNLESMERGLRRWSQSAKAVGEVNIEAKWTPNWRIQNIIDALFSFQVEAMTIQANHHMDLKFLDFANLLILAHSVRSLTIDTSLHFLNAVDICIIRKNILTGECKLRVFNVLVPEQRPFLLKCFGVTIKEQYECGDVIRTYTASNSYNKQVHTLESAIRFYTPAVEFPKELVHFESDLMTTIDDNRITMKKFEDQSYLVIRETLNRVQLNFP